MRIFLSGYFLGGFALLLSGCSNGGAADAAVPDLGAPIADLALLPGGPDLAGEDAPASADLAGAPAADLLGSPPDLAPATHTVIVGQGGFAFFPADLTIHAGEVVHWVWVAGGHSVTSGTNCTPDGKFCSPNDVNCANGVTSAKDFTYDHKFLVPGVFPYFCVPHCMFGMIGTVTVQ